MKSRTIYFLLILGIFFYSDVFAATPSSKEILAPSNTDIDHAMLWLKEKNPTRYKYILSKRNSDPTLFSRLLLQASQEHSRIRKLREDNPEVARLQESMWNNREKIAELIDEYKISNDNLGKQTIRSQLENLLGDQYDLKNQLKVKKLEIYEKRIASAKLRLKRISLEKRNQFVNNWKNKLLEKNIAKQ